MSEYHMGTLDKSALNKLSSGDSTEAESGGGDQEKRPDFLQPWAWRKALMTAKKSISPDSKVFTFRLEHPNQALGLPVGQHLMVRMWDTAVRKHFRRSYTPLTIGPDARGSLELLIKIYSDEPERPGGKMTLALDSLHPGDAVDFQGPFGNFKYLGHGLCAIGMRQRRVRRFVMICGGSGITPILQVLRAVAQEVKEGGNKTMDTGAKDNQQTTCLVLDGNRNEEDILYRSELDALAQDHSDFFRVEYCLSQPPVKWKGHSGHIDAAFLRKHVGSPPQCKSIDTANEDEGRDTLVIISGPKLMEESVQRVFTELNWRKEDLYFF